MNVNYHTHTTRCNHASGTEKEYVEAAIETGLKVLGFSDHTPYPFPDESYASYYRMTMEELESYVTTVLRLREEYRNDIEIHLGLEVEYYPQFFQALLKELSNYPIEYLLLAQHNLGNGELAEPFCYSTLTDDPKRLERYCCQLMEGMDTGCFTYLAHPDLISFTGSPQVYDTQMRKLCRHANAAKLPLEINLLGIREDRRYPTEAFWKIAGEEQCDVILALDAHHVDAFYHPETLVKAQELAEKYRLKIIENVELKNPFYNLP